MVNDDTQDPNPQDGNPFSLIAYVLFKVRHALESREEAGRPPRWVRIARGRAYKTDPLGAIVAGGVNGMAETLSYLVELTLDIEELLEQTDAAKAMAEVVLRMLQAASDPKFQDGVEALVGVDSLGELGQALSGINRASTEVEAYLQYIPEPEDVRGLGAELYRLLCIVQEPFPRTAQNAIDTGSTELKGVDHLIIDDCGKARLCAWAFDHGVIARGLGAGEANSKELFFLGTRRLYQTSANSELPQASEMSWIDGQERVRIFRFDFPGDQASSRQRDIKELVELLIAHGYNAPPMDASAQVLGPAIRENLMKFQAINDLSITGELDNETLNRLIHLDFTRKSLRRARPFDPGYQFPWAAQSTPPKAVSGALFLVNSSADEPQDEGLSLVERTPHSYYVVPLSPRGESPPNAGRWPRQQGWLADASANTRGFVALRSRSRNLDDSAPARYVGGIWSEGEAAHGRFFFAARHVEPWRDGRTGAPGPDALFGGTLPPANGISRMYQWIALPPWLDPSNAGNAPDLSGGWTLSVYASVLQRALFTDRGGNGYPDQGRIVIELYGSDVYSTNVSQRDPGRALASAATSLFPDRTLSTAALALSEVDRNRLWTLRKTEAIAVPSGTTALCLVAEGMHQSAYDIDVYFDDFRVGYMWMKANGQ